MALDQFAAYIFWKKTKQNLPCLILKNGPEKKGTQKRAKNVFFLLSFNLLFFPPKRVEKKVVSTKIRRQQTGLKAIWR